MKRLHGRIFLALLLAGSAAPALADGARPITKSEARSLPSGTVKRRVLEQLLEILSLESYAGPGGKPKHALTDLAFWTTPYETGVAGLCAADNVIVGFRPASVRFSGGTTPVQAQHLEVKTYYHFLEKPALTGDNLASPESPEGADYPARVAANAACAKLKPDYSSFLRAADAGMARDGARAFLSILPGAGGADFACIYEEKTAETCHRELSAMKFEDLSDIGECENTAAIPAGARCMHVFVGAGWGIDIVSREDKGVLKVEQATVSDVITVADWRED